MNDLRIGIIGGSGLEAKLFDDLAVTDIEHVACDTPFGRPSGSIVTGIHGGVPIALLSRHGDGHLPCATGFAHWSLHECDSTATLAGKLSCVLKKAILAFFNIAKCRAELRTAHKTATLSQF